MPLNIQVGQQWRTRGGDVVTIKAYDPTARYFVWDLTDGRSVDADGYESGADQPSPTDLVSLVGEQDAPAHLQRLTVAAPIYAQMLEGNYMPPNPKARDTALRDLARRALSHADILIEEANRAA